MCIYTTKCSWAIMSSACKPGSKQRKLSAWNMYQRETYNSFARSGLSKKQAFLKTGKTLQSETAKNFYKKNKKKYEKQADEANKTRKICTKSRKTGYVRDPTTRRTVKTKYLTAEQASELRVYKKKNKDGDVRWLYGVDKNGKKHYLGGKKDGQRFADDMGNMVNVVRVHWSKKSPQEMRAKRRKPCKEGKRRIKGRCKKVNMKTCKSGSSLETKEQALKRKKRDGLKRAVRKCVKRRSKGAPFPKGPSAADVNMGSAKARVKVPSSKMLADVSRATTKATQQFMDL